MKLENMGAIDFSIMITKNKNALKRCCNCNLYNGSCREYAKKGKCKAYNYLKKEEKK